MFDGVDYGNGMNGGVHLCTNAFITFGFGATTYSDFTASDPGRGILLSALDSRLTSLHYGLENSGESFRIVYVGTRYSSGETIKLEITFFKNFNSIQVIVDDSNDPGVSFISDGSSIVEQLTITPNTSVVLTHNGNGNDWNSTLGSVKIR